MTEEFENEALHYLLDELDEGRRDAFEALLARDPAARAALKTYAEALARFGCDTAPAEPMAAADQRATLAAILAATNEVETPVAIERPSNVIAWTRYVWPVAAAVLLGLNFVRFDRPVDPLVFRESGEPTGIATLDDQPSFEDDLAGDDGAGPGESAARDRTDALAHSTSAPMKAAADAIRANPVEMQRELDRLREAYADLARTSAALRADYDSVMHHIAQRAIAERGLGRLAAMELVDANSFASGNRRGLVDLARGILTEPGVVAVEAEPPPVSPPTDGLGVTLQPETPEPPRASPVPYAWSVYDEAEHRGYLNLYNLPQVPADGTLQLWVRAPATNTFQHVGEVPAQFQGGNGSLFYTLPEASLAPVEILVTQEPTGVAPAAPTGPVVLRGP